MTTKQGFVAVTALLVLAVAIIAGGAYVIIQKQYETKTPLVVDEGWVIADSNNDWQFYRSDKYGLEFKYPLSTPVLEKEQAVQFGKIKIGSSCMNVENSWGEKMSRDFNDPDNLFLNYSSDSQGVLALRSADLVKTVDVSGHKLFVFKQGCYECYGPYDKDGRLINPVLDEEGYEAVLCVNGKNTKGNLAGKCLNIQTERVPKDRDAATSPEFDELTRTLDRFLASLNLLPAFFDVSECRGVGEIKG